MIHDKTDEPEWSDNVDPRDSFARMDLVIGPGYGSFKEMVMVHEIKPKDELDAVEHKGVFWEYDEAVAYVEDRHERTHGYVCHED